MTPHCQCEKLPLPLARSNLHFPVKCQTLLTATLCTCQRPARTPHRSWRRRDDGEEVSASGVVSHGFAAIV